MLHPETLTHNGLRWIDLEQPTKTSLQFLKNEFPFHVLDYEDILAITHRSKIDKYSDYIFLVLLFPLLDRKTNTIRSGEIDFFLGKDYVVTVHRGDIPPFVDLFQVCTASEESRNQYMVASPQFLLYKILQRLFQYCYPLLDNIDAEIDQIERRIFSTGQQSLLQEILVTRQNIIDIRRIVQPHRQILMHLRSVELDKKYIDYFDDLLDYTQEIWNQLESYKESIEALHETNQSLISYRINEVIKTLTVFSALMLPAGVIAGLFGMNAVDIPFAGQPEDFYIFTALTGLGIGLTLLYIKRKKLL
ncbi:MAG: magnesium transporter CorA family protein [Patescibacteria group bacterium]|jgi:magnesium transporter